MALGMVGGSSNERARKLRKIYSEVDRDDVRRGAVLSLGLVGDRNDVKFLINVIKDSEDRWLARYTRGAAGGRRRRAPRVPSSGPLLCQNSKRPVAGLMVALS